MIWVENNQRRTSDSYTIFLWHLLCKFNFIKKQYIVLLGRRQKRRTYMAICPQLFLADFLNTFIQLMNISENPIENAASRYSLLFRHFSKPNSLSFLSKRSPVLFGHLQKSCKSLKVPPRGLQVPLGRFRNVSRHKFGHML